MSRVGNNFFRSSSLFSPLCRKRGGASTRRRLILLLSVGWVPPSLPPSGACLNRGTSIPRGSLHAAEGDTTPGRRLFSYPLASLLIVLRRGQGLARGLWHVLPGHTPLLFCPLGPFLPVFHTKTWSQQSSVGRYSVRGPSLAIAHTKPTSSRAMATVTTLACLPLATKRW